MKQFFKRLKKRGIIIEEILGWENQYGANINIDFDGDEVLLRFDSQNDFLFGEDYEKIKSLFNFPVLIDFMVKNEKDDNGDCILIVRFTL